MSNYKEYPGFTLYPFYHKLERMPWSAAAVIPMDKVENMVWLAGATGRPVFPISTRNEAS